MLTDQRRECLEFVCWGIRAVLYTLQKQDTRSSADELCSMGLGQLVAERTSPLSWNHVKNNLLHANITPLMCVLNVCIGFVKGA